MASLQLSLLDVQGLLLSAQDHWVEEIGVGLGPLHVQRGLRHRGVPPSIQPIPVGLGLVSFGFRPS